MTLFVDTSVWSLVLRRNPPLRTPEAAELLRALQHDLRVTTTGLVLQELLQGFSGPRDREQILDRIASLPLMVPDLGDYVEAAAIRNRWRRGGLQIGTIDALLAQLCVHHDLTMLSGDRDFVGIAKHCALKLWVA